MAGLFGLAASSPIFEKQDGGCSENSSSPSVAVLAKAEVASTTTTETASTATSSVAFEVSSTEVTATSASSKTASNSSYSSGSSSGRNGTTPQTGAIAVNGKGVQSMYKTVQAGVGALSNSSTKTEYLFIYLGTYNEQVYIPKLSSNLEVQGYTSDATSYSGNQATITYNLALKDVATNDETATLRSWNPNTKFCTFILSLVPSRLDF